LNILTKINTTLTVIFSVISIGSLIIKIVVCVRKNYKKIKAKKSWAKEVCSEGLINSIRLNESRGEGLRRVENRL